MIVLKTNRELDMTFDRLIRTMGVPVEWTKHFVVIGDYLILQGRVRSLFFNFESKKVITNVVDIPLDEQDVVLIEDGNKVCNVLNLVLYAFGKWGVIRGIKVEKDYAQVNALFESVLTEIGVEPAYSRDNFRFYKDNVRINYEDVVMLALESTEEKIEEEGEEEEESQGLWHNLVWKKKMASFIKTETTFEERQAGRLGNNFYMVGYQCPYCRENLHMVVFPEGKEFKIETEEGRVLLARAYTCEHCHGFYTPRPKKLLIEGDIYAMEFLNDVRAYGDYAELLGNHGDRVSNYNFNEFEWEKGQNSSGDGKAAIEHLCDTIDDLSREELFRLENMIEEGFYPGDSVRALESTVHRASSARKGNPLPREEKQPEKGSREISPGQAEGRDFNEDADVSLSGESETGMEEIREKADVEKEEKPQEEIRYETKATPSEQAAAKRRYDAKFGVLDRLSIPQIKELRSQLEKETKLSFEDRKAYLDRLDQKKEEKRLKHIRQRAEEGANSLSYGQIQKIIQEIETEELPSSLKEELLTPLYKRRKAQAEAEVAKLVTHMPKNLDRAGYENLQKKLAGYPEADISVYEEKLTAARDQAEGNEIASMMRHVNHAGRQELSDLAERLKSRGFAQELIEPHLAEINERIRKMDEKAIEEICGNPMRMTEAEALEAYEKVKNGMFLPELKTHALEMLTKRLVKIKTDECELLVHKLQSAMTEKMRQNPRHHFYPARRVMMQEAAEEELAQIQYALDTYGTSRGRFEYPILVVDTSRNESGKEGMILTPEHLFYNTLMNAYNISIWDIKGIKTSTGLLNSGISVELKNGTKAKIPYGVERSELKAWGIILKDFIKYLQEKPDSRNVAYLAKEKHETICCFRCGYSYKGGNICPKCGYKMNQ